MENEEQKENSDEKISHASPPRSSSHSPSREAKPSSPAHSSVSSDLSHHSSLSHGSSPGEEKRTSSPPVDLPAKSPSPQPVVNRSVRDEPASVIKVDLGTEDGFFGGVVEGGGGRSGRRPARQSLSILRRVKREAIVKKAELGFRVSGSVFCLIAFSVMAAARNQGWAIDSFYRYKEFRYCLTVNAIGFVYSAAQAFDLAYRASTGNYVVRHQLRNYLDFPMDQMLTYLLISASSSAATRVEDWQSNWGKDKFPQMASASVGMSFMAFVAFAASSLISGYNTLCTFRST